MNKKRIKSDIEAYDGWCPKAGESYQIGSKRYKIISANWTGFCCNEEIYSCVLEEE